jgi:hypothetical protein
MNKKGFLATPFLILIAVIIVAIIGTVAYFHPSASNQVRTSATQPGINSTATAASITLPTSTQTSSPVHASTSTTTATNQPSCTFFASPMRFVYSSGGSYLHWTCKNVNTCSVTSNRNDDFPNQNPTEGLLWVTPAATTNYTLNCASITGATSSNTTTVSVVPPNNAAPAYP